MTRRAWTTVAAAAVLALSACTSSSKPPAPTWATPDAPPSTSTTRPSSPSTSGPSKPTGHVVVVVMENHSYADVIADAGAPYLNALAKRGANLTAMYALTH